MFFFIRLSVRNYNRWLIVAAVAAEAGTETVTEVAAADEAPAVPSSADLTLAGVMATVVAVATKNLMTTKLTNLAQS